ncbi:P2X purinoceptor 6 isoform X6 [Apteryx mantelli]|uniref:P2X purinoceptor 6 isoform X6 n=1 Tax=Apteryx mantelli TaxID=2696672 RepID=A0ABM4FD30_9AVES
MGAAMGAAMREALGAAMGTAVGAACRGLLDYKTAKFALTRNRRVGLLHRLLQLGVLGYLLGWVFLVKKGYQETDSAPRVSVITKLKGISVTEVKDAGNRLWDVADYVKPPQGENTFFLVTNLIITTKQAQGTCPESPSVLDGICREDADCPVGNPVVRGNGIKTGKCVMFNTTHSTCEIYSWCPVENDTLPSPFCPVFRIRDMVEAAGETFGNLALLGGSIGVYIKWDCDLDHPAALCQPQYSFSLQDRNYNFRTASYYWDPQKRHYRSLLKLYGIRFDISVHGQAGKFSIIPVAVSLGASIALLGAVTVVCDLVLLYLDSKADFYRKEKFEEAKPPKDKAEASV